MKKILSLLILLSGVTLFSTVFVGCQSDTEQTPELLPAEYICKFSTVDTIRAAVKGEVEYDTFLKRKVISVAYDEWKTKGSIIPKDSTVRILLFPISDADAIKQGIGESIEVNINCVQLMLAEGYPDEKFYFIYTLSEARSSGN